MKKTLVTALLFSFIGMNIAPAFAVTNTQTPPKTFKSMIKKSKKQKSDDYKYAYVNVDWWKNFNDSNLTDYINRAIKNNYDLKMATLAVEEYYQMTRLQLANELPTIGTGFSPAYAKTPGTTHWDWTFALPAYVNYEADIFLKNRDKTRASKKKYLASQYDERAAYIAIAGAVGTTYLNIVRLDKIIDLQEKIVSVRQDIYKLMLLSNNEGLISTADTIKANKSLIAGQIELTEYKKQREKLLHALAVLIGESPDSINDLAITPYENINFTGAIPEEIASDIIVQRPDFLKAETMVEKAGIDVRVARKEFLPTINLTGVALFNSKEFGSLFSTKGMLAALAAGAMLPIFTGGARIANLKIKKIEYERILQDYYKTNLTAIQEVNDALVSVKRDKEKLASTIEQSELEKSDYRYTSEKYNQGIISRLDLIQVQENLLTIDKLVAQQNIECMVDYIGLYKAVGSKL
ncbi:MAG: efflux transporter outer membrane subunit [Candidatus Gastranaerophilaceae bacterium]|nr:efflux transporter outer membrane subunit [Candidatus Gastranaerophilaceae bacterium]